MGNQDEVELIRALGMRREEWWEVFVSWELDKQTQ